jgi:hypothetical protein
MTSTARRNVTGLPAACETFLARTLNSGFFDMRDGSGGRARNRGVDHRSARDVINR